MLRAFKSQPCAMCQIDALIKQARSDMHINYENRHTAIYQHVPGTCNTRGIFRGLVEYGGLSVDGGKYVERAYSIIETRNLNLKSGENCKFFSSSSFLFSWLFFRF